VRLADQIDFELRQAAIGESRAASILRWGRGAEHHGNGVGGIGGGEQVERAEAGRKQTLGQRAVEQSLADCRIAEL